MQLCIQERSIGIALRPIVGDWQYLQIKASDQGSFEDSKFEQLSISEYLTFKEDLVGKGLAHL